MGKIFGIGLSRTGTTSLGVALTTLGFDAVHWTDDRETARQLRLGNYRAPQIERIDALLDSPVPAFFPQLDLAWPGSKFILTLRDEGSWVESCRAMFENTPVPRAGSVDDFFRISQYGVAVFNEARFRWVFEQHARSVTEYFSGSKSAQLLRMDILGGEGWEVLCAFLGIAVPQLPFPHANAAPTAVAQADERRSVRDIIRPRRRLRAFRRFSQRL